MNGIRPVSGGTAALAAVFLAAFVLSFQAVGTVATDPSGSGTRAAPDRLDPAFFKIPNDQERWRGPVIPAPPNRDSLVGGPGAVENSSVDWPVWRYRTNSEGFRDEDVPDEKPPGTVRILVLGDSKTMGSFVNETDRFTEVLQHRLNERDDPRDYRVINLGVPRNGMFDFYMILRSTGMAYDPDIVVTNFAWKSDISRAEHLVLERALQRSLFASNAAKREHRRDYLTRLSWTDSEVRMYGERIIDLARRNGVIPIMMTTPDPAGSRLDRYRRWAADQGGLFVGPPPAFRAAPASRYAFPDSHHTPEGHRIIADHLYDEITPTLGDIDG